MLHRSVSRPVRLVKIPQRRVLVPRAIGLHGMLYGRSSSSNIKIKTWHIGGKPWEGESFRAPPCSRPGHSGSASR